jgi:periplasmic divalent cation tolerance protein
MNLILVYITNPTEDEAKRIAKYLLDKKLIACANIFPIKSMYWWGDEVVSENEYVLILKTTEEKFEIVKNEVEKIHSYETPCIIKIKAEANEKYFKWLGDTVKEEK